MSNTEAQSAPDNRLICSCGELGTVTPCEPEPGFGDEDGGFRVFCKRDGQPCCMGSLEPTRELAIAAFVRLQAIPVAFTEERDPAGWEGGFADNH